MSRTACEIRGRHDWKVVTDEDGWWPVEIVCTDWECGKRIYLASASSDE